jgi:hypothetical protein
MGVAKVESTSSRAPRACARAARAGRSATRTVRETFGEDEPRTAGERGVEARRVLDVVVDRPDAGLGQLVRSERRSAAVDLVRDRDEPTPTREAQASRVQRRHAAREGDRVRRALERCEVPLDRADIRARVARVHEGPVEVAGVGPHMCAGVLEEGARPAQRR